MILLVTVVLMAMAGFTACSNNTESLLSAKDFYVGLINVDSGQQILSATDAEVIIQNTLKEHKQGASVLPVWGGYKDDQRYR